MDASSNGTHWATPISVPRIEDTFRPTISSAIAEAVQPTASTAQTARVPRFIRSYIEPPSSS